MKMPLETFNRCLHKFVNGDLLPRASLAMKFKIGAAVGLGQVKLGADRVEMLKKVGVVDEKDLIDIDKLKQAIDSGLQAAGELYIPEIGLHIEPADFDRFYKRLDEGAQE